MTLSLVWWGSHQKWRYFNRINVTLFTLFSLGVQAVCLSLAGLLFFSLLVGVVAIRQVYVRFGKWAAIGTIAILPGILFTGVILVPGMKSDIDATGKAFFNYIQDPYGFVESHPDYKTGNEVRLVMWTVGTSEMLQHPFGVGTGNVDEHLNYRLYRSNQKNMVAADYNPHNQFIQTGVEIGIPGLLILLSILVTGFYFAWKHRNWLLLILLSDLAFNALFESMLQRSSGIVFFTLMSCILVVYSLSQKQQKSPENHAD
jgi:O-antigen ligase